MSLRPYQQQALDSIRTHYARGTKKVLLHLSTGGGKTVVFCEVLKSAKEKGKSCIMVVRGRELVDQASRRLDREGVHHGVKMHGHWRNFPAEPLQICSIDTLYRRKKAPKADLIVIDECQHATSEGYRWLIEQYADTYILGVSATPHCKSGLRHIADEVVNPITFKELVEQGFLVDARYYVPSRPKLDDIKVDKKSGDYATTQLGERMKDPALYGDIIRNWRKHADGLPTLAFAVTVEHSKEIVRAFETEGISSAHIEADTPSAERQRLIGALETGEIKVLSSVGTMTTGVDVPCLRAIIMARPTKSYNLYIQILGRGTRPYPGKDHFLVLDHAANVEEHGFINEERECNLDGVPSKPKENRVVTCEVCYHAFNPIENGGYICRAINPATGTFCLHDNAPKFRERVESTRDTSIDTTAELKEVTKREDVAHVRIKSFIEGTIRHAHMKKYKPRWVWHRVENKYGRATADIYWEFVKAQFV